MPNRTGETFTAVFTRVSHAQEFVAHVTKEPGGWHMTDLARKGKTVTWVCTQDDDGYALNDMLETVGCFGSPPIGPKAKLNGITAPASY